MATCVFVYVHVIYLYVLVCTRMCDMCDALDSSICVCYQSDKLQMSRHASGHVHRYVKDGECDSSEAGIEARRLVLCTYVCIMEPLCHPLQRVTELRQGDHDLRTYVCWSRIVTPEKE